MAISSHERLSTPMTPSAPPRAAPTPPPPPAREARDTREASIGDLIGDIGTDLSQLMRDEIELAKAEIKEESTKAGKAAGMLAGAGYAGHLVLLFGSLTVVAALSHVMDVVWAALVVTAVWAVAGAVLYTTGRKRLRTVDLTPEHTVEALKEDTRWARHPRS
ncbi:phage holin family protein [Streptomyces sp. NPDC058664]|uniref:phage holin family protein n=1 Tax=unclassified Streptomyces TaxID=2593676 RepID=UPI00366666DB